VPPREARKVVAQEQVRMPKDDGRGRRPAPLSTSLCQRPRSAVPGRLAGQTVNKRDLSERDICTKSITPALIAAGWER